jgi:DNA-directed RNA polymerase specialized sigma24 family protein
LTPNIEARLDLWSAIGRLSPARSAAIALRYLADLSIEQIGAKLEVSSNTVKTNLRLGLIDLRRLLAAPGSTHARAQEQEVSAMDNISDEQAEQDWDLLAAAAERMVDDEWAFIEGLALEFLQAQQVELDRSEIMADVRSAALRAGRNYASGDFGDEQFRTVVAYPVMNVLRICAALTRLPADQAAAIRLRYGLVGRSASLTGNMAAELHISVAQARALVYEAETQLARDPAVQTALLATAIRPQAPAGWALDPAQDL